MLQLSLSQISSLTDSKFVGEDIFIESVVTDSRTIVNGAATLFAAIKGTNFDGHNYIASLTKKGVKAFIVEEDFVYFEAQCGYVVVKDSITALQKLASHIRDFFTTDVTAVIGSNGKSIVKEWISQLHTSKKTLYVSPRSYNSQLGVALSIIRAPQDAGSYVIETGISQPGEMALLEKMVKPSNVILTTITDEHSENFSSQQHMLSEKLIMASHTKKIIYCRDFDLIHHYLTTNFTDKELRSWGFSPLSDLHVTAKDVLKDTTKITFEFNSKIYTIKIPFTDKFSFENVMSSLCFKAVTEPIHQFEESLPLCSLLEGVDMRMEVKEGRNNTTIINDSYNSDLASLSIALDSLCVSTNRENRVLIISDIPAKHMNLSTLYENVAQIIIDKQISKIFCVGPELNRFKHFFEDNTTSFYLTTKDLVDNLDISQLNSKTILLKGSRNFEFEEIASALEKQVHTTILEINLSALNSNFAYFRSRLSPSTKFMAMVKADAYGCGAVEVSRNLEKQGVNYFAVAYTDEGVKLREAGIKTPIVVLNSEPHGYRTMLAYQLEPEIYSFKSLREFSNTARVSLMFNVPIHLKLDTGMHRLGFSEDELDSLISILSSDRHVKVRSIFSHFTSSDDPKEDYFTIGQLDLFKRCSSKLKESLGLKDVLCHISNSSAAERLPEAQLDMVRLGISLYGGSTKREIKDVVSLKSIVAQTHNVKAGDTVGYSRNQTLGRDSLIATIPIGYADGLRRSLSSGNWHFVVNDKLCPIVGNICMDACMIDVTDTVCNEGDTVTIFGDMNPITDLATRMHTITYEVMTSISPRVKRVYLLG